MKIEKNALKNTITVKVQTITQVYRIKILGYRDPRYKHEILSSQKVTKVTKDTKSYKKLHDITCRC